MAHPFGDATLYGVSTALTKPPNPTTQGDSPDRGAKHNAALRQLANKLVGILHGCLARHQEYDPAIAWAHASISVAA